MEDLPLSGYEIPELCASEMEKLFESCKHQGERPSFFYVPPGLAKRGVELMGEEGFKRWLNDEGFYEPNTHGNLSRSKD